MSVVVQVLVKIITFIRAGCEQASVHKCLTQIHLASKYAVLGDVCLSALVLMYVCSSG